jgi:hypothetical protein
MGFLTRAFVKGLAMHRVTGLGIGAGSSARDKNGEERQAEGQTNCKAKWHLG